MPAASLYEIPKFLANLPIELSKDVNAYII
jgi:hypothetical protein